MHVESADRQHPRMPNLSLLLTILELACKDRAQLAPSKTPIGPADRVKTDRRDAARLARLLRAGELVPVTLPGTEQEALRDLVRLREDAMHSQRRARQQLSSFLLRHGRAWPGKTARTQAHQAWIRSQRFESELQRFALEDYFQETVRLDERLAYLTKRLEQAAETLSSSPLFRALQALRGVSTIVAATIVAELGDLRRFRSASQLMSYVGLVPSERSSGDRTRRGRITKTGNPHLRRVLIQAAWHCHKRPSMSLHMKRRSEGLPPPIRRCAKPRVQPSSSSHGRSPPPHRGQHRALDRWRT